jgi:hypothetical protein
LPIPFWPFGLGFGLFNLLLATTPALEARNMKYVLQFVKAMAQLTVNSIQSNQILQINF